MCAGRFTTRASSSHPEQFWADGGRGGGGEACLGPTRGQEGRGCLLAQGSPCPPELAAGGPGEGRGSPAPQWARGQSVRGEGDPSQSPSCLRWRSEMPRSTFPRVSMPPPRPRLPPELGPGIGAPSYRGAAPRFPSAKLSAGPSLGGGGGGGAPSPEIGGKGTGWGRCPRGPGPGQERAPSPGPAAIKKHVPFLPASSLCTSTTPGCPPKIKQRATPPRAEGGSGGEPGRLWVLGEGQRGRDPPDTEPQSLCGCPDPPPRHLGSRFGTGRRHKEVVVQGDAKSFKGESASAILEGKEGKGGEKKGRRQGGPRELDRGWRGWDADPSSRPDSQRPPPAGTWGRMRRPRPNPRAATGRWEEREGQSVSAYLGSGSVGLGEGGMGGREGRGGGPQPCRSLGRREGRNLR